MAALRGDKTVLPSLYLFAYSSV